MKYQIIFEQLKVQPYFTKAMVCQLGAQYGFKPATIDSYINRSLKRKEIVALRNGLYVSSDLLKNKQDISYVFYLANIIRKPSYISSWSALQYYNLTTEAIYTVTSVTPKITRTYENKAGSFVYQSVKEDLFSDFHLVKGKFDFFIASPAKALFDLLYFKTNQFRGLKLDEIKKIISELRIDFDDMDEKERQNFYIMIKKYNKYE